MINKKSINKVILVGHVGNDPDVRFTKEGRLVAAFSLATHEIKKENLEHTEWHNIVAWAKTGEFVEEHIKKGQLICVEGAIRTRKWADKTGILHSITEIFANNIIPLEWKK